MDNDPEGEIEEEYKGKNNPVFSWRFLRLVSQKNIRVFKKVYDGDIDKITQIIGESSQVNESHAKSETDNLKNSTSRAASIHSPVTEKIREASPILDGDQPTKRSPARD